MLANIPALERGAVGGIYYYYLYRYIVADGGPGVSIQQLALAVAKGDLVAT